MLLIQLLWQQSTTSALVVAQFVQWSIPSPKTCSSNPVIGTFFTTINFIEKTKNKEKRGRECPNFLKQNKVQLGWHALGNNECVATVKDESPDHRHRMGGHLHRDKKNEKSFQQRRILLYSLAREASLCFCFCVCGFFVWAKNLLEPEGNPLNRNDFIHLKKVFTSEAIEK